MHRWGVIAEATNTRLTPTERGAVVRAITSRAHLHPDGCERRYSRATIDRWIRAWRSGGLDALKPTARADTGAVRAHPELFTEAAALRLELPSRSAAQIASILFHRHGIRVAERTVRAQLRRAGLHRDALEAEPKVFGRYEADAPNDRWITDVLVVPGCRGGQARQTRSLFFIHASSSSPSDGMRPEPVRRSATICVGAVSVRPSILVVRS